MGKTETRNRKAGYVSERDNYVRKIDMPGYGVKGECDMI